MLAAALMLMLAADDSVAILAEYRARTNADIRCRDTTDNGEIIVCGARAADRYRLPFIIYDAGDPRHEGVMAERERLQAQTTPCAEHSAFLVGCGMAGVHASARFGSDGITGARLRPLAP